MYFFYFYPLGLDGRTTRYPLATRALTVVMLVAFAWLHYRPDLLTVDPRNLIFYPGNGAPWTALSALLLHAGWVHLVGNLIYFNVFGPPLEDRLGTPLFLLVFLMVGVAGNLVHGLVSVWGLQGQAGMGVLGASGALAGLMALSLARFHSARVRVGWWVFAPLVGQNRAGQSKLPVVLAVLLWIILQGVQALVASETGSAVSYGAHFGGFGAGLILALVLGQVRLGHLEARQARARRFFRQGAFYPAVGEWTAYLDQVPDDAQALLERARCLRLVDQREQARADYGRVLNEQVGAGDWDQALETYTEMRRAGLSSLLGPDLLAGLAVEQERRGDYQGAAEIYRDLHHNHPQLSAGRRALVRLVHLYHGKLANEAQAAYWLQIACRSLPGGSWREYLVREFSGEAGRRAGAEAGPPPPPLAAGP